MNLKKTLELGEKAENLGFAIAMTAIETINETAKSGQIKALQKFLLDVKKEQPKSKEEITKIADKIKNELETEKINVIPPLFSSLQKIEKMHEKPLWENLDKQGALQFNAICYNSYIIKDKNVIINWKSPLIESSKTTTQILICQKTFYEDPLRYSFYMKDLKLNHQNMVAKLSKTQFNLKEAGTTDVEANMICDYIANEFNSRMAYIVKDAKSLLGYQNACVYECPDFAYGKYLYAENFIEAYILGDVKEILSVQEAFAHFSWQFTKGYLMIKDPYSCMHCLDKKKFGAGNLGYEGILNIFARHECNKYCKELSLIHPIAQKIDELPKDFNFFTDYAKPPLFALYSKEINILCDLCKKPFSMEWEKLYQHRKIHPEIYCLACNEKIIKSKISGFICMNENCKAELIYSKYGFEMNRMELPKECIKCRRIARNQKRKALKNISKLKDINF